jgi:hypothetical protein
VPLESESGEASSGARPGQFQSVGKGLEVEPRPSRSLGKFERVRRLDDSNGQRELEPGELQGGSLDRNLEWMGAPCVERLASAAPFEFECRAPRFDVAERPSGADAPASLVDDGGCNGLDDRLEVFAAPATASRQATTGSAQQERDLGRVGFGEPIGVPGEGPVGDATDLG